MIFRITVVGLLLVNFLFIARLHAFDRLLVVNYLMALNAQERCNRDAGTSCLDAQNRWKLYKEGNAKYNKGILP